MRYDSKTVLLGFNTFSASMTVSVPVAEAIAEGPGRFASKAQDIVSGQKGGRI
jgi:hypothetical protein